MLSEEEEGIQQHSIRAGVCTRGDVGVGVDTCESLSPEQTPGFIIFWHRWQREDAISFFFFLSPKGAELQRFAGGKKKTPKRWKMFNFARQSAPSEVKHLSSASQPQWRKYRGSCKSNKNRETLAEKMVPRGAKTLPSDLVSLASETKCSANMLDLFLTPASEALCTLFSFCGVEWASVGPILHMRRLQQSVSEGSVGWPTDPEPQYLTLYNGYKLYKLIVLVSLALCIKYTDFHPWKILIIEAASLGSVNIWLWTTDNGYLCIINKQLLTVSSIKLTSKVARQIHTLYTGFNISTQSAASFVQNIYCDPNNSLILHRDRIIWSFLAHYYRQ